MTRQIPDLVRDRQRIASDPDNSRWVTANAGSGKTHVLAQRVIRLLLRGVDPARILCITFTKAAAANMAARVFKTLAGWTALDDDALDAAIRDVGDSPSPAKRADARRLFARALETPGGLKVQTIHAFCTMLLHQFPFEADVAARFDVLDDTTERQLLNELILGVLLDAAAKPDTPLGQALATAITVSADQTFQDVIVAAVGERREIEGWVKKAGGFDKACAALSATLGIDVATRRNDLEHELLHSPFLPQSEWPDVIKILASGSKSDQEQSDRLAPALRLIGQEQCSAYINVFCNAKLEPRDSVMTKTLAKKHADIAEKLHAERDRVGDLVEKLNAVDCRDRTIALHTVAIEVIARYRAEKDRRGLLDYDDLIDKAATLLTDEAAAWVHYKLDLGVDHVLIDEAQDISPQQWDIVRKLVSEFTSGSGARGRTRRTIFAVGDEKQSIFSFQGSAPHEFAEMARHFAKAHTAASLDFERVTFSHSFRSGANVLGAVDGVFQERAIFESITTDEGGVPDHIALDGAAPGAVEVWDIMQPAEEKEREAWDAHFDAIEEANPRVKLARRIARNVKLMLERGVVTGHASERKALTPGGVLILVRQRGPLFEAIIRALKNENVAVAGADRLVLTEHIAVMDLIALADAILLPQDDLALASVLKSPLFGFDDNGLYEIAWNRGDRSLREAFLGKAGANARVAEAALLLEKLTDAALRESPFTFYARLLGPGGMRKRILARLGNEANDAIDEFLNLALAYESRETPSLQGFVAWLREAEADVKRDMEILRDEVRVMTVHGAKGLEAPVVILADTTTPPKGYHPPKLIPLTADTHGPLVWIGAQRTDSKAVRKAREGVEKNAIDEYRRLLYVGMTRAEERLIVCGAADARNRDGMPKGCWYSLIVDGLGDRLVDAAARDGDERVRHFLKECPDEAALPLAAALPTTAVGAQPWLNEVVLANAQRIRIITPSGETGEDEIIVTPGSRLDRAAALQRGRLVHRLMQSLPDIPRERRAEAARVYLSRRTGELSENEHEKLVAQVLAVLDNANYAALFAPGSRAEVPIVGRLAGDPMQLVSGQVDRLVVGPDAVLIADYKTNSPAPRKIEDCPPAYLRQLALYRAVLQQIYPGRGVRAALVWTDIPDWMELPAALLDAQIATLTCR